MAHSARSWPPARLHVVTGKGGTGKTTVAGALAIALAAGGRRTLLVEVEGRQGIARLFGTPPLPYAERRIAVAPDGGEVRSLAVDVEEALLEYLESFYNLRRAGRALRRMGAIDFATTIAPGVADVLLTGKVKEATTRVEHGHRVYDAVVLDAPPTGRIARFLNVTREVADLALAGPIRTQSEGVAAVLRSSLTAIHIVTLAEEMPVQETVDAARDLAELGLSPSTVLLNLTSDSPLPARSVPGVAAGRLDRARLADGLRAADIGGDGESMDALLDALTVEATEHARRVSAEQTHRATLRAIGLPVHELPAIPGPMDLNGLYELAGALRERGADAPVRSAG